MKKSNSIFNKPRNVDQTSLDVEEKNDNDGNVKEGLGVERISHFINRFRYAPPRKRSERKSKSLVNESDKSFSWKVKENEQQKNENFSKSSRRGWKKWEVRNSESNIYSPKYSLKKNDFNQTLPVELMKKKFLNNHKTIFDDDDDFGIKPNKEEVNRKMKELFEKSGIKDFSIIEENIEDKKEELEKQKNLILKENDEKVNHNTDNECDVDLLLVDVIKEKVIVERLDDEGSLADEFNKCIRKKQRKKDVVPKLLSNIVSNTVENGVMKKKIEWQMKNDLRENFSYSTGFV